MTRIKLSLIFLSFSSLLVSCGNHGGGVPNTSEEYSRDSNGNCTLEFQVDYDNVLFESHQTEYLMSSSSSSVEDRNKQINLRQKACQKFFGNHGTRICKMEIDYIVKEVSGEDLKKTCGY